MGLSKNHKIKLAGNIIITVGVLCLLSILGSNDDDVISYRWKMSDWNLFIVSYLFSAVGFVLRGIASCDPLSQRNLAIFLYMTGYFILIALWDWQKHIHDPVGTYISFVLYVIAFFYPLSFIFLPKENGL